MLSEKLVKIFGGLLIVAALAAGLLMIFVCRLLGPAGAILGAGAAAGFGSAAGIIFAKVFLPDLAESFSGMLLFPKSFLKETPFETGAVYTLMRGPEPWKAEAYLNGLPAEKKRRPEAVLARIELYRDYLRAPESALRTAEEYLTHWGRRANPCGKAILMAYADLALDFGEGDRACEVLKHELKLSIYTKTEKNEIRLRLAALLNQTGNGMNHYGPA